MHEFPQDREPEHELPDDSTTDHDWGYDAMPGVTAQNPQDSNRRDVDDDPESLGDGDGERPESEGASNDRQDPPGPPTPGGGEGVQDPDDAGVSLYRLLDFTSRAYERLRPVVEGEASADYLQTPEGGDLSAQPDLADPGWAPLEQAVDGDYQEGMLLHADALEQAGMEFARSTTDSTLYPMIVDPERYCAALQQMQLPEDTEARQRIMTENRIVLGAALINTRKGIQNPGDPHAHEAQDHIAEELPRQALLIAGMLESLPESADIARAYQQLGTAEREGLLSAWAKAFAAKAIGHDNIPMGAGRLESIDDWDAVHELVNTLAEQDPHAEFTRQVRDNLLEDIDAALERPLNPVTRQLLRQAATDIRQKLR